jgi:hypothetical protein
MVGRQEEGQAFRVQRTVYFISKVLSESKVHYPTVQEILYGILITSRKLRHYFDAYNILVASDFLLANILHTQDATRRISKWVVCYHHNLTGPEDGREQHGLKEIIMTVCESAPVRAY